MLIQLGRRQARQPDLVDNLIECHTRIRHFTELAARLASTPGLSHDEVRRTASAVERYFRDSLPLHARDEEESLVPRLRGHDAILDEALTNMAREHDDHDPLVTRLLAVVRAMQAEPASWEQRKQELSMLSRALEEHFDAHLRSEEELVFPALSTFLSAGQRADIAREMAARRGGAVTAGAHDPAVLDGPSA